MSMSPRLLPGDLVLGWRMLRRPKPKPGDVVILSHDGLEKIKRIVQVRDDEIFVLGDNLAGSKDSRHFGWLTTDCLRAKVIWPLSRS